MKLASSGRMPVELAQDRRHRPDKHSGVPAEISFAQKRFGQIGVRFFAEANDAMNRRLGRATLRKRTGFALLDVTKARAGPGRLDADRDQRARLFRRRRRRRQRFLESCAYP